MGKKILSKEDKIMIAKRSLKENQVVLAKEYGVTQPAISKMLTKQEQRDIIKQETSKLVAVLPDILKAQISEIKDSQVILHQQLHPLDNINQDGSLKDSEVYGIDNIEDALALRKYTQSNERELLKSMGILPTQTTNQYIQQIYNDNRSSVVDAGVLKFLGLNYTSTEDAEEDIEIIEEAEVIEDVESP